MTRDSGFSDAQRGAVYRAIFERRDVRSYLPDPVPEEVLQRVLEAAHHAPSVGFMQPWSFLVIRSPDTKRKMHAHFLEVNAEAARVFDGDRQSAYRALKLQGILDAPVNLVVTCDPKRAGEHVLGRFSMPETDVYSTCLAVQNLWLAARAEGLGVGWMSLLHKPVVRELLAIPEQIEIVAYLTLGYPVEFAQKPLLSEVGWRQRLSLSDVIMDERWGRTRRPSPKAEEEVEEAPREDGRLPRDAPLSAPEAAMARNDELTKPRGSLGVLERITLQLAGLQQGPFPRCDDAHLVLFAADHGVSARRVSAYRRETTLKMVYNYLAGGAVVNALARAQGLPLHVVDVGVDHDFRGAAGLIHEKVARGTRDFCSEPAMSEAECRAAIAAGARVVSRLPALSVLLVGEMGIGNSTSASALCCALLGTPVQDSVGPGTGIAAPARARKIAAVTEGLRLHGEELGNVERTLAALGGFEIAALVGAIEAARERRALVLLDGFITGVAALIAVRRDPAVLPLLVAGHCSAEPAHAAVLDALGLRPLLSLDMRLGEGSGAALALGLLRAGCRVMREVRTFAEANIERPEDNDEAPEKLDEVME